MNKKTWMFILFYALFPPLLIIPIIHYFFYRPLKNGVVGGGHLRLYVWASFILGLGFLADLPIRNLDIYSVLSDPQKGPIFIYVSESIQALALLLLFLGLRNDPEKNKIMPIYKFKPDFVFYGLLSVGLLPLFFGLTKKILINEIAHPSLYAIAASLINQNYLAVIIGFLGVTVITALSEEIFFRGILLWDYDKLGNIGKKIMLFLGALYFAFVHYPIAFFVPLVLAFIFIRIRLGLNNLLPGIFLHAIWNGSIVIALLIMLDRGVPAIKAQKLVLDLVTIEHIWKTKSLERAKQLIPNYKMKDEIHEFETSNLKLFVNTYAEDQHKISNIIAAIKIKPEYTAEKIMGLFSEYDWQKMKDKNGMQIYCGRSHDICFESKANKAMLFHYGSSHTFEAL